MPQVGARRKQPLQLPFKRRDYEPKIEGPDRLGRYRLVTYMENRCCNPMQIGAAALAVVDDFGFLQIVGWEDPPWY